jgi:peptide/nickel transport system permease protein
MSVAEIEAVELASEPEGGLWRDAWVRLTHNPGAIAGFVLVGLFVVAAVFAPLLAPFDPREQNLLLIARGCCPGPSVHHLLGVDQLGRDELSRILYGARYSLVIGVVSVSVGLSVGLFFGAIAGYMGGIVDGAIMRVMDVMLAIPGLLLAIGIVAALGQGLWQIMIAQGTLALATAIIDVAGLGFLGLGPQDPGTPEWGTMLTQVDRYLQSAPFLAIVPGIAIVLSVLGFNLIGDGLREALDPKLRNRV